MSRSQSVLLKRHVKRRDTETRRISAHAGPAAHTARARACISTNAARERSRVRTLRSAFLKLQLSLPSVPPDTKLSKLDVLLLATDYIQHLTRSLDCKPQTTAHSAGHSAGTTIGQTSGHFTDQTNTCQQARGDKTHMQSLEIGPLPRANGRTQGKSRVATLEKTGLRRREDGMPRQERHPVKKWPMRSRLYECNLLDVPPLKTGSNDNDLVKKTSTKDGEEL